MPKNKQILCVGLVVISLAFVGCGAGQKQVTRSKSAEDPTSWSSSPLKGRSNDSKDDDDAPSGTGFFKSSRLPGALSSEGAEIERSLGVGH